MFTHVACFRWVEGTDPADVDAITAALRRLPGIIPEIREYRCGPDAGLAEGNFEYSVVATFDGRDDYSVYVSHPVHRQVISELIRPRLAARVAVQFES